MAPTPALIDALYASGERLLHALESRDAEQAHEAVLERGHWVARLQAMGQPETLGLARTQVAALATQDRAIGTALAAFEDELRVALEGLEPLKQAHVAYRPAPAPGSRSILNQNLCG